MIKWKYKPNGACPVQAEGWFMGHYFYFRARWDKATIDFAKSESMWESDILNARYILMRLQSPEAGWLPHWKCRLLIWLGCLRFIFKTDKNKLYDYDSER